LGVIRFLLALWMGLAVGPAGAETLATREFHAEMSADEQTRFTESPAKGMVDFVVDLATLEVTWRVTFRDLSSEPIGITLHGPAQPGANGVIMLDLAQDGMKNPLEGKATLNEAQVQFMLNRWAYVNVRTRNFPKGEIRGQLTAVRPKVEY
jgi:CHRD domain